MGVMEVEMEEGRCEEVGNNLQLKCNFHTHKF